MAVSYKSQVFRNSPYVLPVDLNLLEKVGTIKQKQFEAGAERIQNEIDQFGLLDVMKDQDKEYLNTKIGNIVDNINNLGGVDLSDIGVVKQIQGLGSNIYSDNNIMNAVSSTKGVRNLMSSYQAFKTNPKLTKQYSEVNEAYDMRKVGDWLNDGQTGSTYHGPSTATPYVPYRDNHIKNFEKIKADLNVELQDNGLYYSKTTNEFIRPERIMSMAADLLTPEERSQMKRDSWYLYNVQSPQTPEQMVGRAVNQFNSNLADAQSLQAQYEQQAKAAVGDPKARLNYNILAQKQKEYVDQLKSAQPTATANAAKSYAADPEEFMYQVYSQDYFRGLGNRFSVNRTDRSIQPNQAEMFQRRYDQQNYQFDVNTRLKQRELDIQEEANAIKAFGAARKYTDPRTGKTTYLPLDQTFTSNNTNVNANPKDLKVTEKSIQDINTQLTSQKADLDQQFIDELAGKRKDLGLTSQSQTSPTGITRGFVGQAQIEDFNGIPGFQMEDLGAFSRADYVDKVRDVMTPEQIAFMANVYKNYQTILEKGPTGASYDIPDGFADLVEKKKMIDLRIDANNDKLAESKNALFNRAGLTDTEKRIYSDYLDHPEKYDETYKSAKAGDPFDLISYQINKFTGQRDRVNNPAIRSALDKIKAAGFDFKDEYNKYLNQLSTRDVFQTHVFTDKDSEDVGMKKYIFDQIQNGVGTPIEGSSKVGKGEVKVENIKPITAGVSAEPGNPYYISAQVVTGSGNKEDIAYYKIPVSDENAKLLGLNRDPYENLNYAVNLKGEADDLPVYGSKDLSLPIRIYKSNSKALNGATYKAQAKYYYFDKNGQKTGQYDLLDIPNTEGMSASEAYTLAKTYIQQAATNPLRKLTYKEFQELLYGTRK
jgi:hypothetical protein